MKTGTFDTTMKRTAAKRNNPAFPLIFQSLKKASLPVVDLDNLFCWQNMEYCLLTLNSEVWEDFYVSWQEEKLGYPEHRILRMQ